jgi:hypothetical protein
MIFGSPLHKLKLPDQYPLQPPAVFHLRGSQALAPSPGPRLRQILERALRCLKPSEPLRVLAAYISRSPSQ